MATVIAILEAQEGRLRGLSYEIGAYAVKTAEQLGLEALGICVGAISEDALAREAGSVHLKKVILLENVPSHPDPNALAKAFAPLLSEMDAHTIVFAHTSLGRWMAPLLACKLNGTSIPAVMSPPEKVNGALRFKRNSYSGKAFAWVATQRTPIVLTLMRNSIDFETTQGIAQVEKKNITLESTFEVKGTEKTSGRIPLTEAEVVVSGGRGMKAPENWHLLEELADVLGAALACSKPVSDMGWRPHSEHVGQTGLTIRPTLYIAVGISGAIQHLAGVNGSKYILAINKDPEAPIFKAASFGVVGNLFEVVPKLTQAIKQYKAQRR